MTINDYQYIGIDYSDAISRFVGNEQLLETFVLDFINDPSYNQLIDALSNNNLKEAFEAAHALKGLSGNLSMITLYNNVTPLVEVLRINSTENLDILLNNVSESYNEIISKIKEYIS